MRFDERIRGRNLVDARPAPSLSIISWNDASSERNTHVPQKKGERKVRARTRHAPILLASHDALFLAIISVQSRERAFPFDEKEPLPPRDAKGMDRKRIEEVFPPRGTRAGNGRDLVRDRDSSSI